MSGIGEVLHDAFHALGDYIGAVTGSFGGAARPNVIPETSESDDSLSSEDAGGTGASSREPRFRFAIEQPPLAFASSEEYVTSVFNWSSKPYVGKRPFWPASAKGEAVVIGPFTIAEVYKVIQNAADKAGFSVYCHKGHRLHEGRVSMKFGCDHGRRRYSKADEKSPAAFEQSIDSVVASSVGKRRALSKNKGYKRTPTAHRRHKCVDCTFSLLISGKQSDCDRVDIANPFVWSMSRHGLAKFNFRHSHHTLRGTSTLISDEVREYLIANGDITPIPELVKCIRRTYRVSLERSQVRYFLKKQEKHPPLAHGGLGESGSGNAMQTIKFLLKSKKSVVVLGLIECDTGVWKTGKCSMGADGHVKIQIETYRDYDQSSKVSPVRYPDPDRIVVDSDGRTRYLVHTIAWNYIDEARVFAAYPWTVAMDVQAGVNKTSDGFNAIGTCGNYHNIVVMRAYISSQKAETFRWLLRVAFVLLVQNVKNIRAFFVDGCQAMLSELQPLCSSASLFPFAQIILCMWHLLTDAYDKKFGYAMGSAWFKKFKALLYRLRNCESEDEFNSCKTFVLRLAAARGHEESDEAQMPCADMVKFIMARVVRPERWVLKHFLATLTRGTSTTQRVEVDQSDSRRHKINATCSWLLSTKKHETAHHEKRIRLLEWSDKQMGRTLCRGPTNAESSTITAALLKTFDSFMLPWALDNFEIQMLLAQKEEMCCVFVERTSEKLVFQVFYDNEDSDAEDVADDPTFNPSLEQASSDESDLDESPNGKKPRSSAASKASEVSVDDDEDLHDTAESTYEDFQFTEDMHAEYDDVMDNPLPTSMKFHWKKVRTVQIIVDSRDAAYAFVVCACGYSCRIGLPCRHFFRVLFNILDKQADFSWDDFGLNFEDFVKMDVVSKVKYHAALRDQDGRFLEGFAKMTNTRQFHPRIPYRLVQDFLKRSKPQGYDRVPCSGLPERSQHLNADDDAASSGGRVQAPQHPPRRESARDPVPTQDRLFQELEDIWNRTKRMTGQKQADARRLAGSTLGTLKDQIYAMQPDVAPARLTRLFSVSDLYKGRAKSRK